jgi:predicted amidophosphoribosyltransferase
MTEEQARIRREKKTITAMMHIYCEGHHGSAGELCGECTELLTYAHKRLEKCRYREMKPTCGKCPVHCYRPSMKERVIEVMRYSGPRMSYRHPVYAFHHFRDGFRQVPDRPKPKREAEAKG